jgi:hypothetical protein
MFDVHCPRHQTRVLLGSRSVDALEHTPDGIVVHWHCHCGATGTLDLTTRRTEAVAA